MKFKLQIENYKNLFETQTMEYEISETNQNNRINEMNKKIEESNKTIEGLLKIQNDF